MSGIRIDTREVEKKLDQLRDDLREKIQRKALRAAGKPIARDVASAAPSRKGALKKSIGTKLKMDKRAGDGYIVIGPIKKAVSTVRGKTKPRKQDYKARFLEEGTRNMRKRAFVGPVYKRHEKAIPRIFIDTISKEIDKVF